MGTGAGCWNPHGNHIEPDSARGPSEAGGPQLLGEVGPFEPEYILFGMPEFLLHTEFRIE